MERALRAALLGLLWLTAAGAVAGPLAPRLIPLDPDFADFGPMRAYYTTLRQRLLGPQRPSGAYVLVTPSFKAEWALQVAWDRGEALVLSVNANDSLWYTVQRRIEQERKTEAELLPTTEIPVTRFSGPLPRGAGQLVEQAWAAMLQAAHKTKDPGVGLDGTTFLFFSTGPHGKQRAGYAWSPRAGTPTAALVDLVEALKAHAEATVSSRASTEAAVVRLSKEVLRQTGAAPP